MDRLVEALSRAVPTQVRAISRTLQEAGHRSWIVGGSVRDIALAVERGVEPTRRGDWDMCTDARPEHVQKLFRKVIPTGIEHGTVTIVLDGEHFEVTTLRGEKGHSDGRRPDEVFFVSDLDEDLARRDFTVNAMAFDVDARSFHDPFAGLADLSARVLRAVGAPRERFFEDGLRVLRCARFCASLDFSIEEETAAAIRPSLASFEKVANERVRDEWFKALGSQRPSRFLEVVRSHGMLAITAPEVWPDASAAPQGVSFQEVLARIDDSPRDVVLRLALFVWGGTPATGEGAHPSGVTLPDRFRLSRQEATRLRLLLDAGSLPPDLVASPEPLAARRWLARVGRAEALDALAMQLLARTAGVSREAVESAHAVLREELASGHPLSVRELAVTGGDLMREAAIPKGPKVGQILGLLLEHVLETPEDNVPERLIELARRAREMGLESTSALR